MRMLYLPVSLPSHLLHIPEWSRSRGLGVSAPHGGKLRGAEVTPVQRPSSLSSLLIISLQSRARRKVAE